MGTRKAPAPQHHLTIAEFHKALDQLSHSHSRYENFRNFIEAAYCALARRTALSRARSDALEESYMAIIRRYAREKEAPHRMAELFGRLTSTLWMHPGDFLGEAYMSAEFGNNNAGQFFTPFEVSSLLARMNVPRECVDAALAQGRPLQLLEPASGSGGMVIAVAEHLQEEGFDLDNALFATLVDIDALCMQMGFLQISCQGIPAVCVHGDSLSLEEYSRAYTIAGARQRGLPIWGVNQVPPEGFAIDLPRVLTRPVYSADRPPAMESVKPEEVAPSVEVAPCAPRTPRRARLIRETEPPSASTNASVQIELF